MDDAASEKSSLQEADSFDNPTGPQTNLEPVFSTAAGVRIDVKKESIEKSKKLLNTDTFSSPLIRKKANSSNAFISPFRRDEQSTSSTSSTTKRSSSGGEFEEPLKKKSTISDKPEIKKSETAEKPRKYERKEIHADVLRVSRIHEKDEFRMILQENSESQLILATCKYRLGNNIKFGDKIHIDADIWRKSSSGEITEVYIDKVLKNIENGARDGIRKHPISKKPFCIKPKFIYELADPAVKKAVLQVTILDLNLEIYKGCEKCKHVAPKPKESSKSSRNPRCENCKNTKNINEDLMYSRIRVSDFSGQMFINVTTKTMKKLLKLFGYEGIKGWYEFQSPQERSNYVFEAIMIEVEKSKDEWECTDVTEVDWDDFGEYLKQRERRELRST